MESCKYLVKICNFVNYEARLSYLMRYELKQDICRFWNLVRQGVNERYLVKIYNLVSCGTNVSILISEINL